MKIYKRFILEFAVGIPLSICLLTQVPAMLRSSRPVLGLLVLFGIPGIGVLATVEILSKISKAQYYKRELKLNSVNLSLPESLELTVLDYEKFSRAIEISKEINCPICEVIKGVKV